MEISHISNFIISNGNLYAAGANSSGQLGIDPQLNGDKIHTYMKVPVNAIITSISNNSDNTAAIDIDGNLWVCGSNYYGQLGLGDTNPRKAFTLVPFNSKIMSVSCGYTHIAVIDEEGNLWVCGGVDTMGYNDNHGQLGLYDIGGVLAFTQVPSNVRFRTVTCEDFQTAAIDIEGNLWVCGNNSHGKLGLGDIINRNILTKVPSDTTFHSVSFGERSMIALDFDGNLWSSGLSNLGLSAFLVKFNYNAKFRSLSCGISSIAAIDDGRNLWVSAFDLEYFGDGDEPGGFIRIPLNVEILMVTYLSDGIIALDVNGDLWVVGNNYYNELGIGQNVKVEAFFQFSIGVPVDNLVNQPVNQLVNQRRFNITKRAR